MSLPYSEYKSSRYLGDDFGERLRSWFASFKVTNGYLAKFLLFYFIIYKNDHSTLLLLKSE